MGYSHLGVLFDRKRRDELRSAIREGKALAFRRQKPAEDKLGTFDPAIEIGGSVIRYDGESEGGRAIISVTAKDGTSRSLALEPGKEMPLGLPGEGSITLEGVAKEPKESSPALTISVELPPG